MLLIRIKHVDKGHTDVVCDGVVVNPKFMTVTVNGGDQDGKVYYRSSGAEIIKYNVGVVKQLRLFDPETIGELTHENNN